MSPTQQAAIRFTTERAPAGEGESYVDIYCNARHLSHIELPDAEAAAFEAMVEHWPAAVEALEMLVESYPNSIAQARAVLAAIRGEGK